MARSVDSGGYFCKEADSAAAGGPAFPWSYLIIVIRTKGRGVLHLYERSRHEGIVPAKYERNLYQKE